MGFCGGNKKVPALIPLGGKGLFCVEFAFSPGNVGPLQGLQLPTTGGRYMHLEDRKIGDLLV